jgi:hypothetical protein
MAEPMAPGRSRQLFVAQFARLADVPPEVQQFASLASVQSYARLPKQSTHLHGVHRHCPARGIAHRHARPHSGLARRVGTAKFGLLSTGRKLAVFASLYHPTGLT